MTEAEWLACDDPARLVRALQSNAGRAKAKAPERKLRLFTCACSRQEWGRLTHATSRHAVEVAERFVEGGATRGELAAACDDVTIERQAGKIGFAPSWLAYTDRVAADFLGQPRRDWGRASAARQADLLRELVGNPFQRVRLLRAWLTPTVTCLAAAAYQERSLPSGELERARLGILADALEEAGCNRPALLGHLRSAGPHVRGCWALDLILGRA